MNRADLTDRHRDMLQRVSLTGLETCWCMACHDMARNAGLVVQ